MIIDAHQHVWNLERSDYHWLGDHLAPINRTVEFEEAREQLTGAGIHATILVQSDDTDADTEHLLAVQESAPEVVGVVGYAPLQDGDRTAERLAELARHAAFCGIRTLIHDLPDPDWLLRDDVDRGLGALESAGVPFDVVAVLPRHLEVVLEVGRRHPDLRMVIDHLAKPPIGLESREPWWSLIAETAKNPNVYGKVSGLYAAGEDLAAWTVGSVRPFVERALDVFGAERLMYGGDWPVSIVAGGYRRVWSGLQEIFSELGAAERARMLGGTAAEFYALSPRLLARAAAAGEPESPNPR